MSIVHRQNYLSVHLYHLLYDIIKQIVIFVVVGLRPSFRPHTMRELTPNLNLATSFRSVELAQLADSCSRVTISCPAPQCSSFVIFCSILATNCLACLFTAY